MKKYWIGIGLAGLALLIGFFATVWFDREKLETKLIGSLIKKLQPSLPFKIDSYAVGKNLEFLNLELSFKDEKIHLNGPLHWQWIRKDGIHINYEPVVQIDGASEFTLLFTLNTERRWDKIDDLTLSVGPTPFAWKKYGAEFKALALHAKLDDLKLDGDLSFDSFAWTDPLKANHAATLTNAKLVYSTPKLSSDPAFELSLSANESELLSGNFYLDLPLKTLPLKINSPDSKTITLVGGNHLVDATWVTKGFHSDDHTSDLNFKFNALNLSEILPWASKNLGSEVPGINALEGYEFKQGTLNADGSLHFTPDSEPSASRLEKLKIKINHLAARSEIKKILVKGLDLDLNYLASRKEQSAKLKISDLYFHHFKAHLNPSSFQWNAEHFSISEALPLRIDNLPLTIGKIDASLKPEFSLDTSVNLAKTPFASIAQGFCWPTEKFPPLTLAGAYPSLQISHSTIDPEGSLTAEVFSGKIELKELGVFNLDTEVAETDFDLDWSGINLEQMAVWSKFGEIKGTLEGYAHDVVFQSLLPTQYHFLFNVVPYDRERTMARVEFSPEAMKNVVKLFTGADIDQRIPGIAGWLMFGWPSHVFGGYDVYYAGLKLTSENGHIVVETLDKPGIFEKEQKHFVLYGTRFKMPLKNSTYPLIVDATSMNNFVHQLFSTLDEIRQKKEGTHHEDSETNPCEPPQL